MRSKTPPATHRFQPEDRQQRLEDFITTALDDIGGARRDAVLLVARSPESVVARAIFTRSPLLAARGIGARIVFAASQAVVSGETWQMSFDPGFAHEIRLVTNPRFLAAHEQLVIGDGAVWFGDSMRRDPDKRDAFSSFTRDAAETTRARQTFTRLWTGADPLYVHDHDGAGPTLPLIDQAPAGAHHLPPETLDSLRAWQASNRH